MTHFRKLLALAPLLAVLIAATPAQASQRYTVQWGDTLTWIAHSRGFTVHGLARANHLNPHHVLVAGTVLIIPDHRRGGSHGGTHTASPSGGGRYTVRWGDTLSGIAARYGTTLTHLAEMNGIRPYGVLLAGASLSVPSHPGAAPSFAPTGGGSFDAVSSINAWSAHYGVDPRLARAVAWMESGYHTGVVSSVGAWGVMQIMPGTWRDVERLIGHPVARTPDGNVRIGVAYLHHLLNVFGGDERLAVAAYYQGAAGVKRFGLIPATQLYVADVLALRSRM
jgi:N-acetylmuramoyl-L-alanine amidase